MPTSGIKVLTIGQKFDLPYESVHLDKLNGLFSTIAKFRPDVIVTSVFIPGALNNAQFELRKKWINVDPKASSDDVVKAIEGCYSYNIWTKHHFQEFNPLISVYTPTCNTGDYIRDTYQSLKEQTYTNWEWVLLDDGSEDSTWEKLEELSKEDIRVRPYKSAVRNFKIGTVKDLATRLCKGVYLVELDHDDMLTDFALDEIKKAFEKDKEIGFVYSNCSNFFENGTFHRFGDDFWKSHYRDTEYRGKKWVECINPDIYDRFGPHHTQQFGWFLTVGPNHVRAFRASKLFELGGYNPNLPVADDWDLYARFFLYSKCHHIDKMLYLYRFLDNWQNTTFTRNKSIQDHLALGRGRYAKEFEEFNAKRLSQVDKPTDGPTIEGSGLDKCDCKVDHSKGDGPHCPHCICGHRGEEGQPGLNYEISTADVSYVIPEAFPSELTVACIKSIRQWSEKSEIILVANGCEPFEEACKLVDKVVKVEMNARFASGCNRGVMEATRKIVCIMNNDAEFVDDTPSKMIKAIRPEYSIVAPYSNRAKWPQGDIEKENTPAQSQHPEMVVGVCVMMPTGLYRKLGGFDSRLDTWEDDDICHRARSFGHSCEIVGGTWVKHQRHATFEALKEDVQGIMKRNQQIFGKKHPRIKVIAISKNEELAIKGYFTQFAHVTRDWCLFDTGSTDKTIEIAKSIGVKVETGQLGDFATARNKALELFGKDADWVIMLDPDERLDHHTIRNIKELVFRTEFDIFLSPLDAIYPDGSRRDFVPKPFLFRSNSEIRWTFLVHEKLIGSLKQAIVKNALIEHIIVLHEDGRRVQASGMYDSLAKNEPYFTDKAFKKMMLEKWPILDYDRMDDERIKKIFIGPLVSVVTPTYQRSELLKKSVESALRQDYVNIEVIVVGDNDSTLSNPTPDSERVRVYNLSKNHGAGGAVPRNIAITMAAGKLIAYLDDDNEWQPNHISSIYELMRSQGAAYGMSSMQVQGEDLGFTEPKFQGVDTSCVVHRKDLVEKYGWWKDRVEGGYAHDWEFISRWGKGEEKWVSTKLPTLLYNAESSGQTEFLKKLARDRKAPKTIADKAIEDIQKVEDKKFIKDLERAVNKESTLLTIAVPAIEARFTTSLTKILTKLFDQAKDKPVEVKCLLDNKKMTLSEKRNQAIDAALGKFIAFVDDDDDVADDYIDSLLDEIRKDKEVDCVVFDVLVHGYTEKPKLCKYGVELEHGEDEKAYYRKPNHVMAYNVKLAKKYLYTNVVDEDDEWSRRASKGIKKQSRIGKTLYHYLYNPKNTQQGAVREVVGQR